MCGIAGFNWDDNNKIRSMTESIRHRGPDAQGFFTDSDISLGHARLSVIDLSDSANQPMISSDGRFTIVFNGEIYNYQEIKDQLSTYQFRTKSDTEVILAGFSMWGEDIVKKLNGMFAFAIWDRLEEKLFLARDRSGIKPLFYYWDGELFIFGSEIKAILDHESVPRILDQDAFNHYLRLMYVPSPHTLISGIKKMDPGSIITLHKKNMQIDYFVSDFSEDIKKISYQEAKQKVFDKTIDSVKRQLVADVPVGVYLSGGVDSSVILYCMTKFKKDIKTFSVGFDLGSPELSEKFNKDIDLAGITAKYFGVEHNKIMLSVDDALSAFNNMIAHSDDLIANPTALALYHLSSEAKKSVTVVLSGNGGDELFGGYERYRRALMICYYNKLPLWMRRLASVHSFFKKVNIEKDIDIYEQFMFEKDSKLSPLISSVFFKTAQNTKNFLVEKYFNHASGGILERIIKVDQKAWLSGHALQLSDSMSMHAGLEERVPLLDNDLLEIADQIPLNFKVTLFSTKKIFKDAFRSKLPPILFKQPKRGFFSPGAKWLRHPMFLAMVREVLSENYYKETAPLFNWKNVKSMLEDHVAGKTYNLTSLWALLVFQSWAKKNNIKLQ